MNNEREYEMMVLLRPEYEEDGYEEKKERITSIIENEGGEVKNVEKWGKRKLAYKINDVEEGLYALFTFKSDPESINGVEERANVEEGVLRYQAIAKEKVGAEAE